jgi:hypothetical protein
MGLSLWLLVAAVLALSPLLLLSTDARILMRLGLYKIFVLLAELVGEVDVEVEGRIERRFEERNDSSISGVEVGGVEEEMVF